MQELKSTDLTKCQDFANWILEQMKDDPDWLLNVMWTDEVHFSFSESVNTHSSIHEQVKIRTISLNCFMM